MSLDKKISQLDPIDALTPGTEFPVYDEISGETKKVLFDDLKESLGSSGFLKNQNSDYNSGAWGFISTLNAVSETMYLVQNNASGETVNVTLPSGQPDGSLIGFADGSFNGNNINSTFNISNLNNSNKILKSGEVLIVRSFGGVWKIAVRSNTTSIIDFFTGIATNSYVDSQDTATLNSAKSYADGLVVGLWDDRGNFNASVNAYPSSGGSGTAGAILKGDIWTVSVAGTLPTSQVVEVGDTVRALIDSPGNTQSNWAIAQNNIGYTPENVSNKDTDTSLTANSDTKYASQKAVKTYIDYLGNTLTTAVNGRMLGSNNLSEITTPSTARNNLQLGSSNDVTFNSVTGSNATANTMAFFDTTKKLVSALSTTFGTWLNTFTAKATPVDADTLTIGDSASSFEAKKVTWANIKSTLKTYFDSIYQAILTASNLHTFVDSLTAMTTPADADRMIIVDNSASLAKKITWANIKATLKSYFDSIYATTYLTTRYAKVDYINGNNGTALLQRADKPYADLQTCYNAIVALGGTDNWIIEIVGDKTIITNELTMNVLRNGNMTLIFQGNITLSIPFSSTSGMFNNIAIDNLTIIFNGNLTQTTNIGLGLGNQSNPNQTNNKFIFNGIATLRHGKSILVDNGNININGNNNYLFFNNLVIDITNISGATGTYLTAVIGLYTNNNCSNTCQINNLTVQGSTTTALNLGIFTSGGNSIFEINSIFLNQINTNYNSWYLFTGTYNKINITTIDTRTNGTLAYKDTIFNAVTANVVNIDNADIKLGGLDFYSSGIKNLNTINYKSNGVIMYDQLFQGVWTNLGTVESTILSQNVIQLKANSKITGGKWIFNCDTNSSCFLIYPNGTKCVEFENMSIYNKGITANTVEGCPFFRTYSNNGSLRLKILFKNVNLSGTLNNTNPATTWIKSFGGGGFDLIKIEGDIVTCYNGALNSNIINNCDINYIEDLNLIN